LYIAQNYKIQQTLNICTGDTLFLGNHSYFQSGLYTDTLSSNYSCDSIILTQLNVLVAGVGLTASPDTIFFAGDQIDLTAIPMNSNDSVIAWIPNSILNNTNTFSNNITPSSTIWVGVQTINQAGCKATDSIRLVKIDVEVPNAFTPNGDNQNDIFLLRGSGLDAVQSIEIFNRWGERVFYSNDPLVGWDGRYLGNMQQVETYTYQIQLKNKNSKKVRTVRGNLLLIL
jgi:gliding motility-associated-like protein